MQPGAPFTVTGFKGGYLTWNAAVKAAKARSTTVTDKDGKQIYPPQPSLHQIQARNAARDNKCPQCGRKIRHNLSLKGWVQCEQFGSPAHRACPNSEPCSWQGFTC